MTSTQPDLARMWRRGQRGWPESYPLAQLPNAPLLVWLAAAATSRLAGDGTVHDAARGIATVALTVWAWEEASHGVNAFRRGLGVVVLVAIAVGLARDLG